MERNKYAIITDDCRKLAASGATLRELAKEIAKTNGCNCDLDNWEPEKVTGHSWVCRIHKGAIAAARGWKEE